jgi:hypothetical protein
MGAPPEIHGGASRLRVKAAFGALVAIALFFITAEHGAHVLPYVPWVLVAACPLMHVFMHGGHRHPKARDAETRNRHETSSAHSD